jgi:hypothetical protein
VGENKIQQSNIPSTQNMTCLCLSPKSMNYPVTSLSYAIVAVCVWARAGSKTWKCMLRAHMDAMKSILQGYLKATCLQKSRYSSSLMRERQRERWRVEWRGSGGERQTGSHQGVCRMCIECRMFQRGLCVSRDIGLEMGEEYRHKMDPGVRGVGIAQMASCHPCNIYLPGEPCRHQL